MVPPSEAEKLPRIVCADRFYMTEDAMKLLRSAGEVVWADCGSEDELVEKVGEAKVIVSEYFRITPRMMDAAPELRGIVVWGVGYDHVDVNAASQRGIYVANTRGSNAESVAEQAFAFILALSRKILQADAFVRGGGWVTREESGLPKGLLQHDLHGKTLGIIGLGSIGTRVARIAHGFRMRVLAHDPYVSAETAGKMGVELVSLETLFRESDFVTVHTVLNEKTRGMVGSKELNSMKPTAYLINTSRGPVVDQEALIKVLREKRIAGASLDVFTHEPISPDDPLLRLDNVLVAPHYAGNSLEALEATSMAVSKEVVRIVQGRVPRNLVNRSQLEERGYM